MLDERKGFFQRNSQDNLEKYLGKSISSPLSLVCDIDFGERRQLGLVPDLALGVVWGVSYILRGCSARWNILICRFLVFPQVLALISASSSAQMLSCTLLYFEKSQPQIHNFSAFLTSVAYYKSENNIYICDIEDFVQTYICEQQCV